MKKTILLSLMGLTIASCSVAELPNFESKNGNDLLQGYAINLKESVTSIKGKVEFPNKFKVKANQTDIATQSTVSIIVPIGMIKANSTIAVGLTDDKGNFKINPDTNFKPQVGSIYILEARKRLGGEGNSILTLKTFIKWTSAGWTSITGGNVFINTKTTAICIVSGYNRTLLNPESTIGKLNIVNGLVVASDINENFKIQDLINAENTVILALNNNQDPTEKIVYSNSFLVFPTPTSTPTASPSPTSTPTSNSWGGSTNGGGVGGGGCCVPTTTPISTPTSTPTPLPTVTPIPTPTPINIGNEYSYSIVSTGYLNDPRGIDIKNGRIYVSDYKTGNGPFIISEGRITVMDFSGNIIQNITGSIGDSLPSALNGVVSNGERVLSVNQIPYAQTQNNIYSFSTSGTDRQNNKIGLSGQAGTSFQDLAIDTENKFIYAASDGLKSIIKIPYDVNRLDASNQQLYFSGTEKITPSGLATDKSGNIFTIDASKNPPSILKFSKEGVRTLEFNTIGKNSNGPIPSAVGDIAINLINSNIYILARINGSNLILKYDSEGNFIKSFGGGYLINPMKMAISNDGSIFITDSQDGRIIKFVPFN